MLLRYLGYALMVVGGILMLYVLYVSLVVDAGKQESRFIVLVGFSGIALVLVGSKLTQ